jgi:Asp-tRNA(Asn)/Glu-tRNA(Gln) amidotransferase A subunit family amidase
LRADRSRDDGARSRSTDDRRRAAWDAQAAKRAPLGMTIGIPKSFYVDDLEADVDKALDEAIATFRKLGARIVQVELPDQTLISAAALIVIGVEALTIHAPWLRTRGGRLQRAGSQPVDERRGL